MTRKRGEARDAILAAARTAFARNGYESTNLKEIATAAEASMTLIYRYFGSKGGLFEEALIAPARAFVDDLLAHWEHARTAHDRSTLVADYVHRLHTFVVEHRGLLAAWADAERAEQTDFLGDGSHGQALRRIAQALGAATDDAGEDEAQMVVACASGLVLSFVIMEGVLLPVGSPLRRPEVQLPAIARAACAVAETRLLG